MIPNIGSEFEPLIELAHKYVAEYPTAEQIILVKTVKNNTYFCVNKAILEGNYDDEKRLIKMLVDADDVEIEFIVGMCENGGLEAPSYHFKESILEICPKNEDAIYVAKGINGMVFKRIKSAMPTKNSDSI